jgi:hypothetical protein
MRSHWSSRPETVRRGTTSRGETGDGESSLPRLRRQGSAGPQGPTTSAIPSVRCFWRRPRPRYDGPETQRNWRTRFVPADLSRRPAGPGEYEADARIRTADPFITSEVLYQLSYVGGGFYCSGIAGKREAPEGASIVLWTGIGQVSPRSHRRDLTPEATPEPCSPECAANDDILSASADSARVSGRERFYVVRDPRCSIEAADEAAHLVTNEVRRVPAEPQETTMDQRPGVVRVPTIHVQETRPLRGLFEYRPCATERPLL